MGQGVHLVSRYKEQRDPNVVEIVATALLSELRDLRCLKQLVPTTR